MCSRLEVREESLPLLNLWDLLPSFKNLLLDPYEDRRLDLSSPSLERFPYQFGEIERPQPNGQDAPWSQDARDLAVQVEV